MDFEKCYDLIDEITDLLVLLKAEIPDWTDLRKEVGKVESDMEDIRDWLDDIKNDDYEETMKEVKQWLDRRCGV